MMKQIIFGLGIRDMRALPKILLLCTRLGATVEYISAAGGFVTLTLFVHKDRSHRFAPQLRRLIDVTSLVDLMLPECSLTIEDQEEAVVAKRHTRKEIKETPLLFPNSCTLTTLEARKFPMHQLQDSKKVTVRA